MFSYVTLKQRVPADHPLREVSRITDVFLRSLSGKFDRLRLKVCTALWPKKDEAARSSSLPRKLQPRSDQ